jgi:outer membrane immunogenic protein
MMLRSLLWKSVAGGAVAAALSAIPALAADIPMGAPPVEPAYVPEVVFTWTGFYLGVHGGYAWAKLDLDDELDLDEDHEGGLVAGAHAGYNYQVDSFVVGVEGDGSYLGIDDDNGTGDLGLEASWLATVRGRAGVALDRFLVYGTGGAAFSDLGFEGVVEDDKETKVGWTAGGGIEGMITPNLTARLEYLFVDLQGEGEANNALNLGTQDFDADIDTHVVRGGLSYKFNW